jgi:very-short-patch-repair endonuclease
MRTRRSPVPTHVQLRVAGRAQEMRQCLTPSEARLWEALRGGRLGVSFRRQVVLGRYIVDFAARSIGLVIEVDGGYHEQCRRRDARRDAELGLLGYAVLHLEASLVHADLAEAFRRIQAAIAACRSR